MTESQALCRRVIELDRLYLAEDRAYRLGQRIRDRKGPRWRERFEIVEAQRLGYAKAYAALRDADYPGNAK